MFNGSNYSRCSSPFQYCEGVCYSSLVNTLSSQKVDAPDTIFVAVNNEALARTIINNLKQLNLSSECSQDIISFICLYLFGLYEDEQIIQSTMNQCEDIQFKTCSKEWTSITTTGLQLPNCVELPEDQYISCQNTSKGCTCLFEEI